MPAKNIFFNVPLPFLLSGEELLKQQPVNVELFVDGEDLEGLDDKQIERARSLLDKNNCGRRVHGPISEMVPGAFDPRIREVTQNRFSQAIDFAGRIAAGAVVLHSGYDPFNKGRMEKRYLENLVRVLGVLSGRAAEKRIELILENTFEPTPAILLDTIAGVGADNLRLCFDVAHHHVFAEMPLAEWLERCASLIGEVHVSDNGGGWDDHLAPGKGRIDLAAFFGLLKKYSIKPVFTFEPHSVEAFVETLEFIKAHTDYFS